MGWGWRSRCSVSLWAGLVGVRIWKEMRKFLFSITVETGPGASCTMDTVVFFPKGKSELSTPPHRAQELAELHVPSSIMPAWHFRRRPSWFVIDGALFIHWVRNYSQCLTDGVNRQTASAFTQFNLQDASRWMFNKTIPKRNFAPSSLAGQMLQLLYHYLGLFLSVLLTKLHIFCRIIKRSAQNKPKMVTPCLSICFTADSNERVAVKFSIWSKHRILDLRNFGSRQ